MHNEIATSVLDIELGVMRINDGRNNDPMLVNVRKVSEVLDCASLGRASIRLIPLDNCPLVLGNARQLIEARMLEPVAGCFHGESDMPLLVSTQSFDASTLDENPGQMVKSAPVVVQNLSYQESGFESDNGKLRDAKGEGPPRPRVGVSNRLGLLFRVEFGFECVSVLIESHSKYLVESLQMFGAPIELGPRIVKKRHDSTREVPMDTSRKETGPKQKTQTGHEIPVPKRGEFYDALKKVAEPPKKLRRGKRRKKR